MFEFLWDFFKKKYHQIPENPKLLPAENPKPLLPSNKESKKDRDRKMEDQKTLAELTEEEKELALPEMIKSEVNLLIFPFFALSRRGLENKTETEYREVIRRGNTKEERVWNVSAHQRYGYPGPFDREVHKVVEWIINENGWPVQNPICLGSLYSLCKRRDVEDSGWNKNRIKEALRKIVATVISSRNAFYHKGKRERITEGTFHLYDGVYFRGETLPDGTEADTTYLLLSDLYLESLNTFYIKPLDFRYLQSLESKIASRLYEILGISFYGLQRRKQSNVWFEYHTLCQLLPIEPQKYYSLAQQVLRPAHNELIRTGFLSRVRWEKRLKKEWNIYYYPGKRAKEELKKAQKTALEPEEVSEYLPAPKTPLEAKYEVLEGTSERGRGQEKKDRDQELISQLTQRGISENPAKQLARKYPERIPEKIEIFDWTKEHQPEKMKDPAAYLRRMVEEDWPVPEGFVSKKEQEEKRQTLREEYQRRVKEAKAKAEEWAAQPSEERIAGHLNFWIEGQKTFSHHQPTEEEIQEKKGELISNLPTKEEYQKQLIAEIERDIRGKKQKILGD